MIPRSQYQQQRPPSPVSLARQHSNASLSPSVPPPGSSPSTSPIPTQQPRSPSIRELRNYHAAQRKSFYTAAVPVPSVSTSLAAASAAVGAPSSAGLGISPSPSPTPPPIPNEHQRKLFYYRTRSGDLVYPEDGESTGGHSSREGYFRGQTPNTNRSSFTRPRAGTLTAGEEDDEEDEPEEELELDYDQHLDDDQGHYDHLRTEDEHNDDDDEDDNEEETRFDDSHLPILESSAPSAAHTEDDDTRRNLSSGSGSGSTSTTAADMGPVDTEDTDPEPSSVFSSPTSTFYGLQTASIKQATAAANSQRLQNATFPRNGTRRRGTDDSQRMASDPDATYAEVEDAYAPMPFPNLPKTKSKKGIIAHMRGKSSVDHIGSSLLSGSMSSPTDDRPAVPPVPPSIAGTLLANHMTTSPKMTSSSLLLNQSLNSSADTSRLSAQGIKSKTSGSAGARLARASQRTSRSLYSDDSNPESHSDEDEQNHTGPSGTGQTSLDSMRSRRNSETDEHSEEGGGVGTRRSSDAGRTTVSSFGNLGPLPNRFSAARYSAAASGPASRRSSGAGAGTTVKRLSNSKRSSQNSKASRRMSKSASALVLRRSAADVTEVLNDGEDQQPSLPFGSRNASGGRLSARDGGLPVGGTQRGSASAGASDGLVGNRGRSVTSPDPNDSTSGSSSFWRRPSAPALTTSLVPNAEILAKPQGRSITPTVQLSAATPPSTEVSQLGAGAGTSRTSPSVLKPASRSSTARSLSVSSGAAAQSPSRSGADLWLSSATAARTAPSSPALSSFSQDLMASDADLVLGGKNEMLVRLLSEQARVDSQTYSVLPSLEALDDAKAEIKRLEIRISDAKRKVKVEMKIRDAAVALRKAYRASPSSSTSSYISPSSSGFGRDRLSTGTRLSVGLSAYGGAGSSSRPASPADVPPLPSSSSISGVNKIGRRERTNSTATSISGFSASASGAATPTPGPMSLHPSERAKAEAKAEADVLAATLKVDNVTRDLYAISDRAATVRATVLEHQARVLVHRVETLEAELVGRGGRSAEEERKAVEREKILLEEKTKHQGTIEKLKTELESMAGNLREKEGNLTRLGEQLRESEKARDAQNELHEAIIKQHADLSKQHDDLSKSHADVSQDREALEEKNKGAEESHRAAISYHATRIAGLENALDLAKRAIEAAKRELAETKTETDKARAAIKSAEDRTALAVEEERLKRVEVQRMADDERIKRSDLEDQVEGLEGSLQSAQREAKELKEDLAETKTALSALEKDLAGAKMTATQAQTEADQLKSDLSRTETQLKDTRAELASVSKEIEKRYEDRVNRLTAESEVGKAAFKAQQELEKRVKGQQSELAGLQKQLDSANEKVEAEVKRRQTAEERDLDLVTNVSKLESEKKRAQDQIAQLQKELEGQRTAAKNALREQLEAESKCGKLEAQLAEVEVQASSHRDVAQTVQKERDSLDGKVRSHLAEITKLAAAVQQHQDSERSVRDDHETKVLNLSRSVDEHKAVALLAKDDHEKALSEVESISRQLAEMQVQLETVQNEAKSEAKLRDEFETQNEKLEESIEELDAQLKTLNKEKAQLTAELETLRTQTDHLKAESQLAQQFEDRNEQLEEEIEEMKAKAEQTSAELAQLRAQSGDVAEEARSALEAEQKAHAQTKAELVKAIEASAKALAEAEAKHAEALFIAEKAHAETKAELADSKGKLAEAVQTSAMALAEVETRHAEALVLAENAHADTKDGLAKSEAKLIEAVDAAEKAHSGTRAELEESKTKLAEALDAAHQAHGGITAELTETKAELAETKAELAETKAELVDLQAELAEAVEVADQHEEALQESEEKLHAASQKLGEVLTKLQQTSGKLQSVTKELGQTEGRATAAEKQFHDLELAVSVERRQMAERDELYHAFELRLENAEKRLRAEDERCARLLGKLEGRDTMDDLLERIKTGATVAKKRTAGQDIAELMTSLSEHITDLADELTRTGGGAAGLKRGLSSEDNSAGNAQEQIQSLEEEVELLEAEAVKWKRDADQVRQTLEEERKINEETQEELTLMEEEAMRWKRDAEDARKLLRASEAEAATVTIASPSIATLATIKKLVLSSPPPPQELPGTTPEEKLSHAVVELHACRQAMQAISGLLPDLAAHGGDLSALGISPTIGLGLVDPVNYPSATDDAIATAERVHASLAVSRVEQYKTTLQSLLRNHAQLRKWHLTARQREKKLEATVLELRHSLDDFRTKAKRADLLSGSTVCGSVSSPSTPISQSPGPTGPPYGGATLSAASNGGTVSVGYHPRQLSVLPKGSQSRLGVSAPLETTITSPLVADSTQI
ncbi:hypothetical protein CF319_g3386 [Tilletia indica]|nr:hypothetical protein CF319_g3386 [Tilletia indica]